MGLGDFTTLPTRGLPCLARIGPFSNRPLNSCILCLYALQANGVRYAFTLFFSNIGTAPCALYFHSADTDSSMSRGCQGACALAFSGMLNSLGTNATTRLFSATRPKSRSRRVPMFAPEGGQGAWMRIYPPSSQTVGCFRSGLFGADRCACLLEKSSPRAVVQWFQCWA